MAGAPAGDGWVWTAFAPEHRLIVSSVVGPRDEGTARKLIRDMAGRLEGALPLFVSDGYEVYATVLLEAFGVRYTPPRTGRPGRPAGPRLVPPPGLRYAQVVKHREGRRVVKVERRVVFGGASVPAGSISTSKVERQNLNLRNDNRRLTRKTICFSKAPAGHRHHVALQVADHNLVQAHLSLRTRCAGSEHPRRWNQRTPAMSAGLTDHAWSMKEMLTYRTYNTSTN